MQDHPTLSGRPPQVVAHRGASHHEPEHTREAYERAIREGADAFECDVWLTADGHLVCTHDRIAERTSNGHGAIELLTLEHLRSYDWGSWKTRLTPHGEEIEQPMPSELLTLADFLEIAKSAGRRIDLAIETKHPTKHRGKVERELCRQLVEFGLVHPAPDEPHVRVMSFSLTAVLRVRKWAPSIPLAWLTEGVLPPRMRDGRMPRGISIAAISVGTLRRHPEFVAQQHAKGRQVHVWTVNEPEDVERCLRGGVDAIITNHTADVRRQVDDFYRAKAK